MNHAVVNVELGDRSYDIFIGSDLLGQIKDYIPFDLAGRTVFIIYDKAVTTYANTVRDSAHVAGVKAAHMIAVPSGEQSKAFDTVQTITSTMLETGVSRNTIVIAVGGGVIGDLAGFCASIVLRGVPFIQIPTTLLSQVDSSVGGKTGINTPQGKNLIGAFYQPGAVIIDIDTLKTLPKREILAGYAEIVKYGIIRDASFFKFLIQNGVDVCALEPHDLMQAIETSVKTKAAVVSADETEQTGLRALLNLGHTFGHALETLAKYDGRLLHGEAVAIGMVMALDLSVRMELCEPEDLTRVRDHLSAIGLPVCIPDFIKTTPDDFITLMRRDKKAVEGAMTFIVCDRIGSAFVHDDVPETLLRDLIKTYLDTENAQSICDHAKNEFKRKGAKGLWKSAFSLRS